MTENIKCILFCEFHPTAGPKITYQVPDDFISKEEFDCVAVYIITKPELQNKLITINALGHKFIGCPISIENAKYSRNALLFNVCLVCNTSVQTSSYEGVVKKLAGYLTNLEVENGFLSQPETKATLPKILSQILHDLESYGKCTVPVDEVTNIHLKPTFWNQESTPVVDHLAPIFVWEMSSIAPTQWDITTQQILPYIDGFNHVQRIASLADVNLNLVRMCIQNMLYYNIITLIPIFQYSNVYVPMPQISDLMENRELQDECIKFVSVKGMPLASFRDIFMLYNTLSHGTTVIDLCARFNPRSLRICERRLMQFGVMKGFLRRLSKFPVLLTQDSTSAKLQRIGRWLNGNFNYDEICCKTGFSHQEIEDIIENDPHCVVIWK